MRARVLAHECAGRGQGSKNKMTSRELLFLFPPLVIPSAREADSEQNVQRM